MDISYYQKINNSYQSKSKQETELYLLNRNEERYLYDNIDYAKVLRNGEPFEMIIIKDTDGNTDKKKIKTKHSMPFNLGDYITWNDQIWLVTRLDTNDKAHHSGYMFACTTVLRWQDSRGNIIERPVYAEDFTKYSSGVFGNNTITIGENQYGIHIPIDEDTKKLKRDMRFPIDLEGVDTPDVYKLTNRKVALNDNTYFGRGGTMILTLSYDSFNKDEDKLIELNGKQVWVCNYHSPASPTEPEIPTEPPTDETVVLAASILGKTELKLGLPRMYTVTFTDKNDMEVTDVDFVWNVVSDFDIEKVVTGNKIELCVDDDSHIGESFLLQTLIDNKVVKEFEITVIDGF